MRAALLTPSDLTGFRAGTDVGAGTQGACPALDTGLDPGAQVTVEVLLEKGGNGPYVRERLILYSGQSAIGAVAAVSGSPARCPSFVVTDPSVGRLDYTVTPLSFQPIGDQTAAVRITAVSELYPTIASYENLVVVRHGSTLIMVAHTAISDIDNALTAAAVRTAYGKVNRLW